MSSPLSLYRKISTGSYNLGSVKLTTDKNGKPILTKVDNHASLIGRLFNSKQGKNSGTALDNIKVRKDLMASLTADAHGLYGKDNAEANDFLARVRKQLLGDLRVSSQALFREEDIAVILNAYDTKRVQWKPLSARNFKPLNADAQSRLADTAKKLMEAADKQLLDLSDGKNVSDFARFLGVDTNQVKTLIRTRFVAMSEFIAADVQNLCLSDGEFKNLLREDPKLLQIADRPDARKKIQVQTLVMRAFSYVLRGDLPEEYKPAAGQNAAADNPVGPNNAVVPNEVGDPNEAGVPNGNKPNDVNAEVREVAGNAGVKPKSLDEIKAEAKKDLPVDADGIENALLKRYAMCSYCDEAAIPLLRKRLGELPKEDQTFAAFETLKDGLKKIVDDAIREIDDAKDQQEVDTARGTIDAYCNKKVNFRTPFVVQLFEEQKHILADLGAYGVTEKSRQAICKFSAYAASPVCFATTVEFERDDGSRRLFLQAGEKCFKAAFRFTDDECQRLDDDKIKRLAYYYFGFGNTVYSTNRGVGPVSEMARDLTYKIGQCILDGTQDETLSPLGYANLTTVLLDAEIDDVKGFLRSIKKEGISLSAIVNQEGGAGLLKNLRILNKGTFEGLKGFCLRVFKTTDFSKITNAMANDVLERHVKDPLDLLQQPDQTVYKLLTGFELPSSLAVRSGGKPFAAKIADLLAALEACHEGNPVAIKIGGSTGTLSLTNGVLSYAVKDVRVELPLSTGQIRGRLVGDILAHMSSFGKDLVLRLLPDPEDNSGAARNIYTQMLVSIHKVDALDLFNAPMEHLKGLTRASLAGKKYVVNKGGRDEREITIADLTAKPDVRELESNGGYSLMAQAVLDDYRQAVRAGSEDVGKVKYEAPGEPAIAAAQDGGEVLTDEQIKDAVKRRADNQAKFDAPLLNGIRNQLHDFLLADPANHEDQQLRTKLRTALAVVFPPPEKDDQGNPLSRDAQTEFSFKKLFDNFKTPEAFSRYLVELHQKIHDLQKGGILVAWQAKPYEMLQDLLTKPPSADLIDGLLKAGPKNLGFNLDTLGTGKLPAIWTQTLAELSQSAVFDPKSGYGKYVINAFNDYFDKIGENARRQIIDGAIRSVGDNFSFSKLLQAILKRTGPIMQKILQGIPAEVLVGTPLEGLLDDFKSSLDPIPAEYVRAQLYALVKQSNGAIDSIEVTQPLGAASVAQAFLCLVKTKEHPEGEEVVVKIQRPEAANKLLVEEGVFRTAAKDVGEGMKITFEGQLKRIKEEFDFVREADNVQLGHVYHRTLYQTVNSMELSTLVAPATGVMMLKKAPGVTVDRLVSDAQQQHVKIHRRFTSPVSGDEGEEGPRTATSTYGYIATVKQFQQLRENLRQKQKFISNLVTTWTEETFYGSGFYHGDLHAGNIIVDDNGATVIDYGNATRLTESERQSFMDMVGYATIGWHESFLGELESILSAEGKRQLANSTKRNAVLGDIKEVFAKGGPEDSYARLLAAVAVLQRHQIETPASLYNFLQCLIRISGTMTSISNEIEDIGREVRGLAISLPDVLRKSKLGRFFDFSDMVAGVTDPKALESARSVHANDFSGTKFAEYPNTQFGKAYVEILRRGDMKEIEESIIAPLEFFREELTKFEYGDSWTLSALRAQLVDLLDELKTADSDDKRKQLLGGDQSVGLRILHEIGKDLASHMADELDQLAVGDWEKPASIFGAITERISMKRALSSVSMLAGVKMGAVSVFCGGRLEKESSRSNKTDSALQEYAKRHDGRPPLDVRRRIDGRLGELLCPRELLERLATDDWTKDKSTVEMLKDVLRHNLKNALDGVRPLTGTDHTVCAGYVMTHYLTNYPELKAAFDKLAPIEFRRLVGTLGTSRNTDDSDLLALMQSLLDG